jgi:hypothetical protein
MTCLLSKAKFNTAAMQECVEGMLKRMSREDKEEKKMSKGRKQML